MSCEGGDDGELGDAGGSGDGGRGERCERGSEVGTAYAGDTESGSMERLQESVIERVEEIEAFDRLVAEAMRLGEAIKGFEAAGEIIEGGKEGKVAAVAAEEDVAEVVEAVDGLF